MDTESFFDADQIAPADGEVEIVDLSAEPFGDHRRVKVNFRLSFFQEPPNAALSLFDAEGEEITSVDVVNIFHPVNEVVLHIPKSRARLGKFRLELTLFKLGEREARADEEGEVKLTTQGLSSRAVIFTLQ